MTLRQLDTTPEPVFDRERGEWIAPDGRLLRELTQPEMDDLMDTGLFAEAEGLHLPWAADWVPLKMALRKAVLVRGREGMTRDRVREAVADLDRYGEEWGLARHGRLFWGHFGDAYGVGSYFRIVDIRRFSDCQEKARAGYWTEDLDHPPGVGGE